MTFAYYAKSLITLSRTDPVDVNMANKILKNFSILVNSIEFKNKDFDLYDNLIIDKLECCLQKLLTKSVNAIFVKNIQSFVYKNTRI